MDSGKVGARRVKVKGKEVLFRDSVSVKNAGKGECIEGELKASSKGRQGRSRLYCLSFWLDSKTAEVRSAQSILSYRSKQCIDN